MEYNLIYNANTNQKIGKEQAPYDCEDGTLFWPDIGGVLRCQVAVESGMRKVFTNKPPCGLRLSGWPAADEALQLLDEAPDIAVHRAVRLVAHLGATYCTARCTLLYGSVQLVAPCYTAAIASSKEVREKGVRWYKQNKQYVPV